MSDESKFFRFVWRFNAVVLALLCLAAVVMMGFNFTSGFFRTSDEKPQGHFAPVPNAAQAKHTYRLRSSGSLAFVKPGAQEVDLVFWLGDWEGNPSVYGLQDISGSNPTREPDNANLLLVNTETGEGRWLFSGFSRNVENWDTVIDRQAKNPNDVSPAEPVVVAAGTPARNVADTQSVVAIVLKVIDKDTNGDGVLGDKDGISFYIYRPSDKAAIKLLDADLVLSQAQVGADRYAISYETGGAAWVAVYSVPDFKLLTKKPLPKLPG